MTLTTTIVGFSLVFENTDFLFLALFENLGGYLSTCNGGLANLNIITGYEKNFVKSYFSAFFSVQFFYGDNLTFFNTVLFTTGFNDCVHLCTSSLLYSPDAAALRHLEAFSVRLRHSTYVQ